MNDVVKNAWADAGTNNELVYVRTYSGYRTSRANLQGVEYHASSEISDQVMPYWMHG